LISGIRSLFLEYQASRPNDAALQDFDKEILNLPGCYAPPEGCLLLACQEREVCGCVAIHQWSAGIAEMKRLYVRPLFRRLGAGKALVKATVVQARVLGYSCIRLDTLPTMIQAQALYRSLGFQEIPAYRVNPNPGTKFFEMRL
jgi:ribosomal protein S18 acetylase RimI-like enzyme